jgi:hypothetical protein
MTSDRRGRESPDGAVNVQFVSSASAAGTAVAPSSAAARQWSIMLCCARRPRRPQMSWSRGAAADLQLVMSVRWTRSAADAAMRRRGRDESSSRRKSSPNGHRALWWTHPKFTD